MRSPRGVAIWAAGILTTAMLAGCTETGDFGRPKPTFWTETAQPALGRTAAQARGEPVSDNLLTDDEQELRNRAWRFLMPAQTRNDFDRHVAAQAVARVLPSDPNNAPLRYWDAISSMPDRSPRARYQRLREDVEADRELMGPFAAVACRVIEMDRVRLATLSRVADPGPEIRAQAQARVAENNYLISWVRRSWSEREEGYRLALERLVISSPDRDAIRSERQLTAFAVDRSGVELNALARCEAPRGSVTVVPGGGRYVPRTKPAVTKS
jgi:hypothetical protein